MKRVVGIVAFLLVVAGIVYLLKRDTYNRSNYEIPTFALEDVDGVDRIVLQNMHGERTELTNESGTWMVNGEYPAFQPQMEMFLNNTLQRIRIKGPVAKQARKNVIQMMIGRSIHVSVFSGEEELRSYYVGMANAEQNASYLHIKGQDIPYIASIPGSTDLLLPKFPSNPQAWYDKTVFDFNPEEIQKIEVIHNQEPVNSFTLERNEDQYTITPPVNRFSQEAAKSYFALFKFKNFEGYANYLTETSVDSVLNSTPLFTIRVTPVAGEMVQLTVYPKGGNKSLFDRSGNPIVEDTDRYFARFNDFHRIVTIQDYVFHQLLIPGSFFSAVQNP